ncbi:MAG: 2-C-methyl-D-erythritol 2,4-cyclodiphosphate synthase [bacterium]|nr:MAG: 2-C-methyl-D-erythritol 2,4-cyclodiphosphate synthase [bacterium]
MNDQIRVGIGYDSHRLVRGRRLVLGGVDVPHGTGLQGHSDADVLTHALMDALLGAAGLGDIGRHFPDTDPRHKGAHSVDLLREVLALLESEGWEPVNADVTLLAERPRIADHVDDMVHNLEMAGMPAGSVNIKATRGEGMGFVGRQEGMACMAVALIRRLE